MGFILENCFSLYYEAIRLYSQRVTANIHHQLQRWISIFGCLASRTPLVVHLCLYTAETPPQKNQKLATFLLLAGGRLQRHTESRPTGNGTNEKKFLYNDYIYRSVETHSGLNKKSQKV